MDGSVFGGCDSTEPETETEVERRRQRRTSVLDYVFGEMGALKRKLGKRDTEKVVILLRRQNDSVRLPIWTSTSSR